MPWVDSYDDFRSSITSSSRSGAHRPSAFTGDDAKDHYQPDLPLKPCHIDLNLKFDIPARRLDACVTTKLISTRKGARTLRLHAERFDKIESVRCFTEKKPGGEEEDIGSTYSYDGHVIDIVLEGRGVALGANVKCAVTYMVENPVTGLFYSPEGMGNYVVSDHETERARYWLPCVDHPSVRCTLKFTIDTVKGLTVLANGELKSQEPVDGGRMVTIWEMAQITPSYLTCVAIGDFVRAEGGHVGDVEVAFFCPKGGVDAYTSEALGRTFCETKDMIEWMEAKLACKLPWPKYYQFAVGEIGGAMENSSLVSWDEAWITDDRDHEEASWQVNCTNLHELAHSWFGNSVVCADFAYSFLKESFAKFIETEWLKDKLGMDDSHHHFAMSASRYMTEAARYVRPIVTRRYDASWSLFDGHLYPGGAWRLHMLRNKLGDDVFWSGIQSYIKDNQWHTVEPSDLRKALERRSGVPLAKFFDQWFEKGVGYPVLELSVSYDAERAGRTLITIKQTQCDSEVGIGYFELSVDVDVEVSEGKWESFTIDMDDDGPDGVAGIGRVVANFDAKPLQVVVDPNGLILHKLAKHDGGEEMLKRTLTKGRTYPARLAAASLLIDSGSRTSMQAVCQALVTERHAGLRIVLVQLLSSTGKTSAEKAMISALQTEKNARVIAALTRGLQAFAHSDSTVTALVSFLEAAETHGYRSVFGALASLGQNRSEAHVPLLRSFLEDPAKRGKGSIIHIGAIRGLSATCSLSALEALKACAPPGRRANGMIYAGSARAELMDAIADCVDFEGYVVRRKTFEFLMPYCTNDPQYEVRQAAGRALVALADVGYASHAFKAVVDDAVNQDLPRARALAADARENAGNRAGGSSRALAAALEKVTADARALRTRVDELEALVTAKPVAEREPTADATDPVPPSS